MKRAILTVFVLFVCGTAWANDSTIDTSKLYIMADLGVAYGKDDVGTIGDSTDPPDKVDFDFGSSEAFSLGMGYAVSENVRTELSVFHAPDFSLSGPYENNGESTNYQGEVDLETTAIMFSAYIDLANFLKMKGNFVPYVGAGMGYSRNKLGRFSIEPNQNAFIEGATNDGFAWKAVVGAAYKIVDNWTVDASFSYMDFGKAESTRNATEAGKAVQLNSPLEFDVVLNAIMIGVRYNFD